jgi:hypothetical protein
MSLARNKRGIELSMNLIIIAIILIIVLVVMVLFFTSGSGTFWQKLTGIFGTQTFDYSKAQLQCNTYCNNYQTAGDAAKSIWQKNFCANTMDIDTNGDRKAEIVGANCIQVGVSCPEISSCGA